MAKTYIRETHEFDGPVKKMDYQWYAGDMETLKIIFSDGFSGTVGRVIASNQFRSELIDRNAHTVPESGALEKKLKEIPLVSIGRKPFADLLGCLEGQKFLQDYASEFLM